MTNKTLSASVSINAPAQAVYAVLADPAKHPEIDGTGWVRGSPDARPLTEAGQVFRMNMYHPDHPDGDYQMFNLVEVCDPPHAISWKPGYQEPGGSLGFGGWTWRYDLTEESPGQTTVRLTYDWSAVPDVVRQRIQFPPFPASHLDSSLAHLAGLVNP